MEEKIQVWSEGVSTVRQFHVTVEISNTQIERFTRPFPGIWVGEIAAVGPVGKNLLYEIFSIPGVTEVFIQPYELQVHIGQAFNWNEIESHIIDAIKRAFGVKAGWAKVSHHG